MTTTITVAAQLSCLSDVQSLIDEALAAAEFPASVRNRAALACEEIFVNICCYAGATEITIRVLTGADTASVTFADDGSAFDPLSAEAPDIEASAEDRPVGGLGIHMVRQLTDGLSYRRTGTTNVFTMTMNRKDPKP